MAYEQEVLQSLAAYGAPLASAEPRATLGLEDALVGGLELSHRKAVVFRTLPVVLLENRSRLDWDRLKRRAAAAGETRALGLLVDLTASVAEMPELRAHVADLPSGDERGMQYYFEPKSKYERASAEDKSPHLARRWGYWLNTTEESLRALVRRFVST